MTPAKIEKELTQMTKADKQAVIALLESLKVIAESATDTGQIINALDRIQSALADD